MLLRQSKLSTMINVKLSPIKRCRQVIGAAQVEGITEEKVVKLGLDAGKPNLGAAILPNPIFPLKGSMINGQAFVPTLLQKAEAKDTSGITIWMLVTFVSLRSYLSVKTLKALGVYDDKKREGEAYLVKILGRDMEVFVSTDHFAHLDIFGLDARMGFFVELKLIKLTNTCEVEKL